MEENIHQNRLLDKQLIVYIEFDSDVMNLYHLEKMFELFRGKEIKCTEVTLSFGAMYAIELADVIYALDTIFDYDLRFSMKENALIITMEEQ